MVSKQTGKVEKASSVTIAAGRVENAMLGFRKRNSVAARPAAPCELRCHRRVLHVAVVLVSPHQLADLEWQIARDCWHWWSRAGLQGLQNSAPSAAWVSSVPLSCALFFSFFIVFLFQFVHLEYFRRFWYISILIHVCHEWRLFAMPWRQIHVCRQILGTLRQITRQAQVSMRNATEDLRESRWVPQRRPDNEGATARGRNGSHSEEPPRVHEAFASDRAVSPSAEQPSAGGRAKHGRTSGCYPQ